MTVDFRTIVSDASSGTNLAELPLTFTQPISRRLNGCGQLQATIPVDHPQATKANLEGDREITVLRNDAPIWNGPITNLNPSRSSGLVQIVAREPTWYLGKRTLEVYKSFNADEFYIVRWLFNYAVTKTSTAGDGTAGAGLSINALIPRFSIVAPGSSGFTKKIAWGKKARFYILDLFDLLVADPTTGLEYRVDYTSASTRQFCQRKLVFGAPSLGVTQTRLLTEHVLSDYSRTSDRDRAGNRVHTIGSGYTWTLQNTGSIAAGDILIETTFDRSDSANHSVIQWYTREERRRAQPPVRSYTASYTPGTASQALPWGFCDLGDTVPLQISGPGLLAESSSRRVIEIDVTPPTASSQERVDVVFNLPLDQLGT